MAHREWRSIKDKPGATFSKALRLAWAVEKKRAAGPEYYQPDGRTPSAFQPRITAAHVISATGRARDFIWL